MLIDDFMPAYDVHERHARLIHAPTHAVYQSLKALDIRKSPLTVMLFKLRGLPNTAMNFDGLARMGFVHLAEVTSKEILFGVVGQFWKITGGIIRVTPVDFLQFNQPGCTKAAWNFSLDDRGDSTLLTTETRVRCTDEASRRRFRLYWTVVGPFSGLIRREMLRLIAQTSETV